MSSTIMTKDNVFITWPMAWPSSGVSLPLLTALRTADRACRRSPAPSILGSRKVTGESLAFGINLLHYQRDRPVLRRCLGLLDEGLSDRPQDRSPEGPGRLSVALCLLPTGRPFGLPLTPGSERALPRCCRPVFGRVPVGFPADVVSHHLPKKENPPKPPWL